MAISYIGASSALVASANATTTTFSNAFTAATSGSNRKLVVVFGTKEDTPSITSVSYNGQALAEATSASQSGSVPDTQIYIYYLDHSAIPTDGAAHDLVIVSSDAMNPLALILEYAGVAQGAPSQTDTDVPTGGAAGTCSFTSVVDGSLIVAAANNAGATVAFTPGGGLSELSDADQTNSPQFSFTVSHIVGTSGSTFDVTEDPSGTADTAMCAALWAAAAAGGGTVTTTDGLYMPDSAVQGRQLAALDRALLPDALTRQIAKLIADAPVLLGETRRSERSAVAIDRVLARTDRASQLVKGAITDRLLLGDVVSAARVVGQAAADYLFVASLVRRVHELRSTDGVVFREDVEQRRSLAALDQVLLGDAVSTARVLVKAAIDFLLLGDARSSVLVSRLLDLLLLGDAATVDQLVAGAVAQRTVADGLLLLDERGSLRAATLAEALLLDEAVLAALVAAPQPRRFTTIDRLFTIAGGS